MLTFMSQWLARLGGARLRALPNNVNEIKLLPSAPRAALRLVTDRDTPITVAAVHVGATAFVAGQGARIYSLDAFRPRHPTRPRAA